MHLTTSSDSTHTTSLVVALCLVVALAGLYLWYAFALSRLFPKLGAEGRKGWIPLVNDAEVLSLGGVPSWTVLLNLVPVVNLYAIALRIRATGRVNAGFGKSGGMTALAILFPPLWATMLASSQPLSVATRMAPTVSRELGGSRESGASRDPRLVSDPTTHDAPLLPTDSKAVPSADKPVVDAAEVGASEVGASDAGASVAGVPEAAATARVSPYLDASSALRTPSGSRTPSTQQPTLPSPTPRKPRPAAPRPATPRPATPRPATPPSATPPPATLTAQIPWVAPVTVATPVAPDVAPTPWSPNAASQASIPGFLSPFTANDSAPDELADAAAADSADADFADGQTVFVDRRPKPVWRLVVEDLGDFPITGPHVLLGRKPSAPKGTQALTVPDATRTLSKVHARLDRVDDEWVITDLNSTNGVVIVAADGTERLLEAGQAVALSSSTPPSTFILGSLAMSICCDGPSA